MDMDREVTQKEKFLWLPLIFLYVSIPVILVFAGQHYPMIALIGLMLYGLQFLCITVYGTWKSQQDE